MNDAFLDDTRCVDLLIERAVSGLNVADASELDDRLARYPGTARSAFEPAVAALTLAAHLDLEPLPAALAARLRAQGAELGERAPLGDLTRARRAREIAAPTVRSGTAGWWAAAAAVLLAIGGWYPRIAAPPAAPTPAQLRDRLLARGEAVVHWEFSATSEPAAAGASGDVVFDPATQQGYLRLRTLGRNDPRQSQYQLWIFDAERDDRYPVDGGVFDMPPGGGEVLVPITARVHVAKPALFAVTVERPGGVVVSGREHIVVLAKPGRA